MATRVTSKDCIGAIRAASKKKGGISDEKAELLLADIKNRARKRAVDKFMAESDAIKEIGEEILLGQKYEAARQKRNALLNIRGFRQFVDYAAKNNYALGVERFLQVGKEKFIGLKTQFEMRYLSKLEELDLIDDIKNRDDAFDLDFRKEMWNLSQKDRGKPEGVTKNESAKKVAKIWHEINSELIAMKNRHGSALQPAENFSVSQTHLREKIHVAARDRFGKNATQSQAYQVWRESFDQMHVDWDRVDTGGQDREKWLREFFRSIYSRTFDRPDEIDFDAGGRGTSLADKANAERKLWFKDPESEQMYDKMWGHGDAISATFAGIRQSARMVTLLQHLGPNPDRVFERGLKELDVQAAYLENGDAIKTKLKAQYLQRMYKTLTGEADSSYRPNVSRLTDIAKVATLLSKGTKFVISSLGDKMAADTSMKYQGLRLADRLRMQLEGISIRDKEKSGKTLRDVYAVAQSYIQEITMMNNDMRLARSSRLLNRLTSLAEKQFKYTGFTGLTDIHHRAPAYAYSMMLGNEAGNSFDKLRPEMQRAFDLHNITPVEWDAWRKYSTSGKDLGAPFDDVFLTPDRLDDFTDEDWAKIVQDKGEKVTPYSIKRSKDDFNLKTRSLFNYIISDANNDPTLRVQSMKSIPGQRGNFAREAWEAFMMFKSYPLTQLDRHLNREYLRAGSAGLADYVANNKVSAFVKVAEIVGKGTIAGLAVIWINDIIAGKTPKSLIEKDGSFNEKLLLAGAQRGGGLGIYSDFLFGEYDRKYNNPLETAAGPILGQIPVALTFKTDVVGEGKVGYKALKIFQDNAPLINLPIIKPILDHLIFFQLQEALNPGIQARRAAEMRKLGYQDYIGFLPTPQESVAEDPLGVQEMIR